MPRVIHFDISAHEPERAIRFYTDVFGWQVHKWDGPADYWLVRTGADSEPGINGGISKKEAGSPLMTVNTIEVPSLDDFINKVTQHGGKLLGARMTIPGVGYLAMCQDTEGNMFGIMESDNTAQ